MNSKVNGNTKSIYTTKEFRELQMKWYRKLDSKGFVDIERSGVKRQECFNERGGLLLKSSSAIRHLFNSFTLQHFIDSGKFSYYRGTIPKILLYPDKKLVNYSTELHQLRQTSPTSPIASVDKVRLSYHDRIILKLYADGKTLKETSKYMRRYCKQGDLQYSIFYVYTRRKRLLNAMKYWQKLQYPDRM